MSRVLGKIRGLQWGWSGNFSRHAGLDQAIRLFKERLLPKWLDARV
jgi:hypothetical protein